MQRQHTVLWMSFLSIFLWNGSFAQNLVPNPGFERTGMYRVYDWDQPSGEYFHLSFSPNRKLNKVNGLCFLNTEGSEYLQAKLKAPLVRGKKYHISLWVAADGPEIENIEILFSGVPYKIQDRMFIFASPQVKIPLQPENIRRWVQIDTIYTAQGAEKYLVLGHFFTSADTVSPAAAALPMKRLMQAESTQVKAIHDSFDKQFPVWTYEMEKRNNKKEKKNFDERVKELSKLEKASVASVANHYVYLKDSARKVYHLLVPYHLRPKFDNICVAPLGEDGSFSCEDTSTVSATATDDRIPLNDLTFETDKAIIQPQSYDELDLLAEYLLSWPELRVRIYGYTDNVGPAEHNLQLSTARAQAVADYLAGKGIPKERLSYKGYGASDPIATNDTEQGRHRNRRVEMELVRK